MQIAGTISEILSHKGSRVFTIQPEAMVFDAIYLMAEMNIGALLVMSQGRLVGMITERDYTRKVALRGKSSKQTAVGEIISSPLLFVTPEETVEECMRIMTENRVRHLPVLNGDRVAGIVSIGDLVNWTISAQSVALSQLESYITGGYPG